MDFYNRVKSFLGLPNSSNDKSLNEDRSHSSKTDVRESIARDEPSRQLPDEYERFGFNIFSSPLEMHRYFEHQMNEMMKSFGMFHNDDSFFGNSGESFFGKFEEPFFGDNSFNYGSQFPRIEDFHKQEEQQPSSLRDRYLKPGYEQPKPNDQSKTDIDLDGSFDMGNLDTVLRDRSSQLQPRTFVFGQSMSTKTIRNADGTVETHRTITDQDGNREITVTRRQGDKEYTKITRMDKSGQQEVTENLVNLDEKDKDAFLGRGGPNNTLPERNKSLPPNWFPFDRFFK